MDLFLFILGCIAFLVTLVLVVVLRHAKVLALIPLVLAVLFVCLGLTVMVPAKTVGIPVTFGKPGEAMTNGLHWKAPATNVVKMDASVQDVDNADDNPTKVKDADDANIFVHNRVRWSIKPEAADELYLDYKEFDRIRSSLVEAEIQTAIATVFSDYAPLADDKPNYDVLAKEVQARLQERVGDRVVIHSVSIPLADPSEATQGRIDALNAQRGETRIAQERKQTAELERDANNILAESVRDPNVLVAQCLKMVETAEPGKLPAGFTCFPGGGNVVVPAAR